MRTSAELVVVMHGRVVGTLHQSGGRTSFDYDPTWPDDAPPLSLSMPRAVPRHRAVDAWLWGLLPDNDATLQGWGRRFGCSPRNPFRLLAHVGEDCAGAATFVPPDRLEGHLAREGSLEPLDEAEMVRRIARLRGERGADGRTASDGGQFSLAGAQPKTALTRTQDGGWAVPTGSEPTTHILKPTTPDSLGGQVENEHFCLRVMEGLGFRTVASEIVRFGDHTAIVTARYDRVRKGDRVVRVHQEDACQALGVHPVSKYASDGGPGIADVARLLSRSSAPAEDRRAFLNACVFNWIVAGTDAHAKNYSVLLAAGGRVRLAPLYDVASVLPYADDVPMRRARLAMPVAGKYKVEDVQHRHWDKVARDVRHPPDQLHGDMRDMLDRLPDVASDVAAGCAGEGLVHPVLDALVDGIASRTDRIARSLERHSDVVAPAPAGP